MAAQIRVTTERFRGPRREKYEIFDILSVTEFLGTRQKLGWHGLASKWLEDRARCATNADRRKCMTLLVQMGNR